MKKEDNQQVNEKIENLEKRVDLKIEKEISNIRLLLEEKILPLLEATHEQAKKTNGRVNKLEEEQHTDTLVTEEFKKKVDRGYLRFENTLTTLQTETDLVRICARYPKITITVATLLYAGLFFDKELGQLLFSAIK